MSNEAFSPLLNSMTGRTIPSSGIQAAKVVAPLGNPYVVFLKRTTDNIDDDTLKGSLPRGEITETLDKYASAYISGQITDENAPTVFQTALKLVQGGTDVQVTLEHLSSEPRWSLQPLEPRVATRIRQLAGIDETSQNHLVLSIISTKNPTYETLLTSGIRARKLEGKSSARFTFGYPNLTAASRLRLSVGEDHLCVPMQVTDDSHASDEEDELRWSGILDATTNRATDEILKRSLSAHWPLKSVKSDIDQLKQPFAEAFSDKMQSNSALIGVEVDEMDQNVAVEVLSIDMTDKGDERYLIVQNGLPAMFDSPTMLINSTFDNLPSCQSSRANTGADV